jgi:hypothetical protein
LSDKDRPNHLIVATYRGAASGFVDAQYYNNGSDQRRRGTSSDLHQSPS